MKKIISIFLIVSMVLSFSLAFSAEEEESTGTQKKIENLYGDVNSDGVVGDEDAVFLVRYVSGVWKGVNIDMAKADVNLDGEVGDKDAVLIKRYVAEWDLDLKINTVMDPEAEVSLTVPATVELGESVPVTYEVSQKYLKADKTVVNIYSSNSAALRTGKDDDGKDVLTAYQMGTSEVTVMAKIYIKEIDEYFTVSDKVTVNVTDKTEKVDITSSGKSDYKIVYTEENAAVPSYVDYLKNSIKDTAKADITLVKSSDTDSGKEIVVGFDGSVRGLGVDTSSLRAGGFIIKKIGDKIAVIGKDAEGADRAVRYLTKYYYNDKGDLSVPSDLDIKDREGYAVKKMSIGNKDISEFAIVVDAETTKSVNFAASELQKYVKLGTGVEVPIVKNTEPTDKESFIRLDSKSDVVSELGDDGFIITTIPDQMLISGSDLRGILYGVYEFLEQYMGWRFVFADYEFLYETDNLIVPVVTDKQIPVFLDRDSQTYSYGQDFLETVAKRKINSWKNRGALEKSEKLGYATGYVGGAHSFQHYISGVDGTNQPDLTSDAVYEECKTNIMEKIDSVLEKGNTVPSISASQMDNRNIKNTRKFRDLAEKYESQAASTIIFVNKLSAEVAKEHPGTKIWTLSYQWTSQPPKGLTVSDDVIISFAFEGCYNHPIDSDECVPESSGNPIIKLENQIYLDYLKGWTDIAKNVHVWYYPVNYHYYLSPMPFADTLRQNFKTFADYGVSGIYAEGEISEYRDDGSAFEKLEMYLVSLLAWDPYMSEAEYEFAMNEFLMIYYGDGWQNLREYVGDWTKAGDLKTDWMGNFSKTSDMLDMTYYADNYARIRELFDNASAMSNNSEQANSIQLLSLHMEFLSLSGQYQDLYVNGSDAEKQEYLERYQWLYHYIKDNDIWIRFDQFGYMPETDELTDNPLYLWYHDKGMDVAPRD